MARPGPKPQDPRKLQVTFHFETVEQGLLVRRLGGGPRIKQLVREWLEGAPVTADVVHRNGIVEIRVRVPRERLGEP